MVINAPPKICFKKNFLCKKSVFHRLNIPPSFMSEIKWDQSLFIKDFKVSTHTTKANNMKVVCNVSVQTMVFTPPLKVYTKIMKRTMQLVAANGMFRASKTKSCNTLITKNNRTVAPKVRDKIKNPAPHW